MPLATPSKGLASSSSTKMVAALACGLERPNGKRNDRRNLWPTNSCGAGSPWPFEGELARKAKIQTPTLIRMEARTGEAVGLIDNIAAVRAVLESAGVEFTNGGVRLAKPKRKGKGK